ncbi:MAG: xanthine dehydrogenase family protein molybdopterin-binding subunit, partial [Gemmatimonadales bacterium]|nr:xanthine dehydrogenase family protein molybdopterin-binding subunit [Gemmatimonadales bacterium]
AGDVGAPIVNPSGAAAQVVGAVLDGVNQAVGQRILLENGRIQQRNFPDPSPLRMVEAVPVEFRLVRSSAAPTGLGEPALPPLAPALVNALAGAFGRRFRTLPLRTAGLALDPAPR